MGLIRILVGTRARDLPLSPSTRIGRHWSSDGVVAGTDTPLHWLEIRWRGGGWCWRTLSAAERTRGTGGAQEGNWRLWSTVGGRVRLDGCAKPIEVQLIDAAPPGVIVEAMEDGRRWADERADQYLERWLDGRVWPLGAEPSEDLPLKDGQVFQLGEDVYRVHLPAEFPDTDKLAFDVMDSETEVEIDPDGLRATLSCKSREAVATGECVRVLAVYAQASLEQDGGGAGGWLSATQAHEAWVALGGRADSPIDRLAWERGKLRTQLGRQGVRGLEHLFETRRQGRSTEVRLGIPPDRIHTAKN